MPCLRRVGSWGGRELEQKLDRGAEGVRIGVVRVGGISPVGRRMDKLVGSRSAVISRNVGPNWATVKDDGFWEEAWHSAGTRKA